MLGFSSQAALALFLGGLRPTMPRDLTSGTGPPYTVLQPLYATYTDPSKRLRTAFRHVNKHKSVHMGLVSLIAILDRLNVQTHG